MLLPFQGEYGGFGGAEVKSEKLTMQDRSHSCARRHKITGTIGIRVDYACPLIKPHSTPVQRPPNKNARCSPFLGTGEHRSVMEVRNSEQPQGQQLLREQRTVKGKPGNSFSQTDHIIGGLRISPPPRQ